MRGPGQTGVDHDRIEQVIGRMDVALQQQEAYGGIKFGSGFFGWLSASGMVVLLGGLVAIAGYLVGTTKGISLSDVKDSQPLLLGSAGVVLAIIFVGYICGGYVAGRMARFNGVRQGVAVWLWAVVTSLALVAVGLVAGNKIDLAGKLSFLPLTSITDNLMTTGGIGMAAAVVILSLLGAMAGGQGGMAFHRRVDGGGEPRVDRADEF